MSSNSAGRSAANWTYAAAKAASLSVADLNAQRAWYQRALGLHEVIEEFQLDEPAVRTVVLRSGSGVRLELIERAGASRNRDYVDPLDAASTLGFGHWAVSVRDLDAAFAAIVAAGGVGVWPPVDAVQPGARFAYVKDPEGNLIELIQPPATTVTSPE
ncbi:VOC family protein [Fodinicola feengrottensis]|uniref:VOC family protein n=1 Tax=Fodinicola feengrottensis TaxID=435914 RepID=UPI0031D684E1